MRWASHSSAAGIHRFCDSVLQSQTERERQTRVGGAWSGTAAHPKSDHEEPTRRAPPRPRTTRRPVMCSPSSLRTMVAPGYTGTGVEPILAATIYRALFSSRLSSRADLRRRAIRSMVTSSRGDANSRRLSPTRLHAGRFRPAISALHIARYRRMSWSLLTTTRIH
jgi:hypothetical protein